MSFGKEAEKTESCLSPPPEETAKALQRVFVCVQLGLEVLCPSLLSTIHILMASQPQEAVAICLAAPRFELASGQARRPEDQAQHSPMKTDRSLELARKEPIY